MKRKTCHLTQEHLKELATYNTTTGNFVSKLNRGTIKVGDILGYREKRGYIQIRIDNITYLAHRLAFLYMTGTIPVNIDHIDNDPSNNSWANLRLATPSENSHNSKLPCSSTTGIKGLHYYKDKRYYQAQVKYNYKCYSKYFPFYIEERREQVKEKAINWLQETRKRLHGEFTNHG